MEKRLKWNAIGLESKTKILINFLENEKSKLPTSHSKDLRKLQNYIEELKYLTSIMDNIKFKLIPELEQAFRIKFQAPELTLLALSRPSIRNVYEDISKYSLDKLDNPLKTGDYEELACSGDAGNVLALIGDSVLGLVVVESLWDSSLATVGGLTKERSNMVSNENLAKVCDRWNLFDYRLKRLKEPTHLTKGDKIEHEKGTLVESIFGVIYLEFGYSELLRIIPHIQ